MARDTSSAMPTKSPLDILTHREIAVVAAVDVRTLERALAGLRVRPAPLERIRRAMVERGFQALFDKCRRPARASHGA